jgi:hypothetical protein
MTTNAEMAATLLRNSAEFFRDIGQQYPRMKDQMNSNAQTFDTVAALVESDPEGEMVVPDGAPTL